MKTSLEEVAKLFPEVADAVAQIKAERVSGMEPEIRRTYKECKNWHEAWVYIFRRAFLSHNDFLRFEDGKIICVVWPVRDFNDNLVGVLEKIAARIGLNRDLVEMRLVNTKVTSAGVGRLKAILPLATVKIFSREDADRDQTIEYVNTKVGWIRQLHARKQSKLQVKS